MDRIQRFRRMLRCRLLETTALVMIASPALLGVACGKVVVDAEPAGEGGGGAGGGTGGAGGTGAGLPYSTGSLSGSGTSTGSGCGLSSTGTAGLNYQLTECIDKVEGKCPTQYQVTMYIVPSIPCSYVVSVDCGPILQDDACCYLVTEQGGGCP